MNDLTEEWRWVPEYEGAYEVSSRGRVRSVDRTVEVASRWGGTKQNRLKGKILSPVKHVGGHLVVSLGRNNLIFVHRLVLMAFHRMPAEGEECRHLDGNKTNNCIDNLVWGTRFENIADRKVLGEENPARGERSARAKFAERDVHFIRSEVERGRSFAQIARDLGASRSAVGKVAMGYTWAWL